MPKRILIDARMVSRFEHGISRFVSLIAEAFSSGFLSQNDYEPIFILNAREQLKGRQPWASVSTVETEVPFLNPKEWFEIPRLIRETRADAFHSPSFASFPSMPVPHMQTIHDLIHLGFGSLPQKMYYQTLLKRSARKAKVLASVSSAARDEICDWAGLPRASAEVHVNAFESMQADAKAMEAEQAWLRSCGLEPRTYFLSVANDKPHKNLALLREAHSESGIGEPLIVAHEFLKVRDHERKSDFAFNALFRNAKTVMSPSLVEGFGRVPIESILFGVPVVLSDIPVHREILKSISEDAVRFVEPRDKNAWILEFKRISESALPLPSQKTKDLLLAQYSKPEFWRSIDQAYRKLVS